MNTFESQTNTSKLIVFAKIRVSFVPFGEYLDDYEHQYGYHPANSQYDAIVEGGMSTSPGIHVHG